MPNDPANADVDAFTPYASLRYTYDSNIYRLDEDAPDIGDRDDNLLLLALGFDSDITSGLQRYEIGAEVNQTFFEAHDDLNYTGGRALALWHWDTGSGTVGKLGYEFHRSLRDFANQSALDRVEDLRTEHNVAANADFDLPGQWRLGVRGDFADISFSTSERLDLQRATAGLNVGYVSTANSVVGLDVEYIQGRYVINENADFDELTVGPTFDWQPTQRSQVTGRIGYTMRDNLSKNRADFDDVTGDVVLKFDNEAGRKFSARVWRDITNLGDEVAEYALVNGISIEPSWQLSSALDLRLRAAYEQRDFQATEEATDRRDEIGSAGAFVDWKPRQNITVTFGGDMQSRSSTRILQDYEFGRVQLQVTARF